MLDKQNSICQAMLVRLAGAIVHRKAGFFFTHLGTIKCKLPRVSEPGTLDPISAIPWSPGGGDSVVNNRGGWLDSLGSGILVGKRYFGVLQKYRFGQ